MSQDLEPITSQKAVDLDPTQREDDASERTVPAPRHRLKHFVRWCGITHLTISLTVGCTSLGVGGRMAVTST